MHGLMFSFVLEAVRFILTNSDVDYLLSTDYLVKPLRQNEIRNLWTRVPVLVALFSKVRMRSAVRMLRRYDCQIRLLRRRHCPTHESSVLQNIIRRDMLSIAGSGGTVQRQPRLPGDRSSTRSVRKQPN